MDQQTPTPANQPNQPPVPLPPAQGPQPVVPGSVQTAPPDMNTAFNAHGGSGAPHITKEEYEFIMNPPKPQRGIKLGGESKSSRLTLVAGGGVALLVVLLIIAKLFSHPNPIAAAMLPVAQEQQAILHLTGQQVAVPAQLSATQTNFVATTSAVITSASNQLNTYLAQNRIKLNAKLLGGKISPTVDQQLTAAQQSGIFQSTYTSVMTNALNAYAADLNAAYSQISGPNGRAYLKSQFSQVQLLAKQLTTPAPQPPATN